MAVTLFDCWTDDNDVVLTARLMEMTLSDCWTDDDVV